MSNSTKIRKGEADLVHANSQADGHDETTRRFARLKRKRQISNKKELPPEPTWSVQKVIKFCFVSNKQDPNSARRIYRSSTPHSKITY